MRKIFTLPLCTPALLTPSAFSRCSREWAGLEASSSRSSNCRPSSAPDLRNSLGARRPCPFPGADSWGTVPARLGQVGKRGQGQISQP